MAYLPTLRRTLTTTTILPRIRPLFTHKLLAPPLRPCQTRRFTPTPLIPQQQTQDIVIVSEGNYINIKEIENILLDHPLVHECLVIAHPESSEDSPRTKAFVVLKAHLEDENDVGYSSSESRGHYPPNHKPFLPDQEPKPENEKPDGMAQEYDDELVKGASAGDDEEFAYRSVTGKTYVEPAPKHQHHKGHQQVLQKELTRREKDEEEELKGLYEDEEEMLEWRPLSNEMELQKFLKKRLGFHRRGIVPEIEVCISLPSKVHWR